MLFYQIRNLSLLVEKLLGCQLVCLDQDRLHNWKALLLQGFTIAISISIPPAKIYNCNMYFYVLTLLSFVYV